MAVNFVINVETQGAEAVPKLSANLSAAFASMQADIAKVEKATTSLAQSAQAAATSTTSAHTRMASGLQQLSQATQRQVLVQGSLAKSHIETGRAAEQSLNQFQRLQRESQQTTRSTDQFVRGLSLLRTTLSGLGVTVGIAGLVQLGRSIVEAGLQMERFQRTLTAATGSATAGQAAFAFITAESNRLGQSVQSMVPVFTQLTAATRGTTIEGEKTRALFSALAGAGVAVGLSTEATGRAMTGLVQIISQNAIQLDEFRNQFSSQIPGAMAATARALREMGVTARGSISEMLALIEKGKLPVETLMDAVTTGLQEVAAAAPNMSNSVEAAFNKFSNDAFQLKADLARSGLLEFLGELAKAGADAMFNAGQALGLAPPNVAREMQQAQKELSLLLAARQEYQAVAERAQKQGLVPESELMAMAELDKRIEGVTKRLQGYQDQFQAGEKAAKIVSDDRKQALQAEKAEEDKFFQQRKQQQEALAARPSVLQAEGRATAERLKSNLEAIKQNYDHQRVMANQWAQEQIALAPKEAQAIGDARQKSLDQIQQRESHALLSARETQANQKRDLDKKVLQAEIAAAGENAAEIAKLRAREPAIIAEHAAEIASIRSAMADVQTKESSRATESVLKDKEKEVKAEERTQEILEGLQAKHSAFVVSELEKIEKEHERLDAQQERELQRSLDNQARAYEHFSGRITSFLADTLEELMRGTLDALDFFKVMLIKQLANITANVISPFISAISATVIQSSASFLPQAVGSAVMVSSGLAATATGATGSDSGLLETGGTALTGVALAKQLYSYLGIDSLVGSVRTGFGALQETFLGGIDTVFGSSLSAANQAAEMSATLAAEELSGGFATGASNAASSLGTVASIAGGLAALGGGIYAALNASNAAAKAASAASAAAGAFAAATAAYGAITGAAVVTAGGTGWTGIGLIVAAVMAVIGVVLDKVIKPAGPSLAVGAPRGLNVGTADGRLQVQGDLGSHVFRREGVDPAMAKGVQAQLEAGITSAVISIVDTINAVALNPAALVGPTQEALQTALRNLQPINSANAKKLEGDMKDITEQLRFANVAIVGGMLEPLNLAFDQLRDTGDVKQQLERLPATTKGLVDIFKTMNTQLDEIAGSQNTDVLRQLSGVRNQVEDFGNRIAGTAGQVAESIVNAIITQFDAYVGGSGFTGGAVGEHMALDATGAAITRFDLSLAEQITMMAELMNNAFGALSGLRTTRQTLEDAGLSGGGIGSQIDRLTEAMGRAVATMSSQIVTTALQGLSADLDRVLVQPLQVQATTVNGLFNDALASLGALGATWQKFSAEGLATGAIEAQFTRLVGGILDTTTKVLDQAFASGSFSEFLGVLLSIPKAVTDLNPAFAKLRAIGEAFATVVGPIAQAITTLEDSMRTTAERVTFSSDRITDLKSAIADAGTSADQALPLFAQLSQEVLANAELQIQMIREIAQAWESAFNQVQSDIDALESSLGSLGNQLDRAVSNMITSAHNFNVAASSGDTLAAIEAIQVYEQDLVELANLEIQQVEQHRQMTIDAQQSIIDGVQQQVDAQQGVIDSIEDEADAQQRVIDGTQQLVDAQQKVIDGIHDQMDAQQKVIDAYDDQIDAQQDIIDAIQDQIDAQQEVIDGTREQIDAVNDVMRAHQEHIDLLQDEVNVRQEAVDSLTREIESLRQLRDRVGDLTRAGLSPARQAPAIREEMAATQTRLMSSGGDDAIRELEKLISLNEELIALGESSDQLVLIKEGLDNLGVLQEQLNAQLGAKEAELPIAQQQLDAANAAVAAANLQLDAMNAQLDVLNAQLAAEEAVLGAIQDQQKAQQDVLSDIQDQKKGQEDILKAIQETQLEPAEAKLSELNTQLEAERAKLDAINARVALEEAALAALNDQLKKQQAILAEVEKSSYWDEQIATINTILLGELYNVRKWLAGVEGYTTWEDQILTIQKNTLTELQSMERYLAALFTATAHESGAAGLSLGVQRHMAYLLDAISTYNLALPLKVHVGNFYEAPRQRGGLVGLPSGLHYAQGGMVPVLGEPGERVLLGPMSHAQQGAAMAWNQAWPRFATGGFTVPGSGSGDTVPMMLPSGSFILNRRAAGALGFQDGGPVQGSRTNQRREGDKPTIINVDLRGAHFSNHEDLNRLSRMLEELRRKRGDTRL